MSTLIQQHQQQQQQQQSSQIQQQQQVLSQHQQQQLQAFTEKSESSKQQQSGAGNNSVRLVPSGKVYRQLFEAQVQLSDAYDKVKEKYKENPPHVKLTEDNIPLVKEGRSWIFSNFFKFKKFKQFFFKINKLKI